eukprot:SAG31_NODE_223_length_19859_cov_14.949899_10_plen_175_part_00
MTLSWYLLIGNRVCYRLSTAGVVTIITTTLPLAISYLASSRDHQSASTRLVPVTATRTMHHSGGQIGVTAIVATSQLGSVTTRTHVTRVPRPALAACASKGAHTLGVPPRSAEAIAAIITTVAHRILGIGARRGSWCTASSNEALFVVFSVELIVAQPFLCQDIDWARSFAYYF